MQAYQYILWKQCYTLIHTIGLPEELEIVIKDLWALRLQLLKVKVDATPDQETIFSSQLPVSNNEAEDDFRAQKHVLDKAMPSLIDSLGLCYLGMVLLRLPVTMGDLHHWAVREDIPFVRAIRIVPAIIREKLPSEYLLMLDTTAPLERDQVGLAVHNLGLYYRHHFAVILPPLNAPLLIFKYIKDLALPTSLFPTVQNMAALIDIDFSFPAPGRYISTSASPETSLISLLVIAVKFYHPFDSRQRYVLSLNDCAALQINWSQWTEALKEHESRLHARTHLARGTEMHVDEEDAMQMSDGQLDDYLDWYERTWIDEDRARHKSRSLDEDFRRWFPTGRQDGSSPASHDFGEDSRTEKQSIRQFSDRVIQAMLVRDVLSEEEEEGSSEDVNRIGSHYKRYRSREELPVDALAFHEAVATASGMKLQTLLKAVLQIESKLINLRRSLPKERHLDGMIRQPSPPVHRDAVRGNNADETEIDDTQDGDSESSRSR